MLFSSLLFFFPFPVLFLSFLSLPPPPPPHFLLVCVRGRGGGGRVSWVDLTNRFFDQLVNWLIMFSLIFCFVFSFLIHSLYSLYLFTGLLSHTEHRPLQTLQQPWLWAVFSTSSKEQCLLCISAWCPCTICSRVFPLFSSTVVSWSVPTRSSCRQDS